MFLPTWSSGCARVLDGIPYSLRSREDLQAIPMPMIFVYAEATTHRILDVGI